MYYREKDRERQQGDKKSGWLSASYTVEAAFIVPVILGVCFVLLYFLYYEHDKALLYANIKQEVIALAQDPKDMPNDVEWSKRLQKNLWMAEVISGSVSKTTMQIKGSAAMQMCLQIPIMEYFMDPQQSAYCSYCQDRWQPERILRQRDTVAEIGEK